MIEQELKLRHLIPKSIFLTTSLDASLHHRFAEMSISLTPDFAIQKCNKSCLSRNKQYTETQDIYIIREKAVHGPSCQGFLQKFGKEVVTGNSIKFCDIDGN